MEETSNFKFKKENKIRNKAEFGHVMTHGSKVVSSSLVILAARSEHTRLGLVVSRKVGSAVVRNRVKRQLREIFRLELPSLKSQKLDFVVIARRSCREVDYKTIKKSMLWSFAKLQKLSSEPPVKGGG